MLPQIYEELLTTEFRGIFRMVWQNSGEMHGVNVGLAKFCDLPHLYIQVLFSIIKSDENISAFGKKFQVCTLAPLRSQKKEGKCPAHVHTEMLMSPICVCLC